MYLDTCSNNKINNSNLCCRKHYVIHIFVFNIKNKRNIKICIRDITQCKI